MATFPSIKTAVAIAATVMALAVSAPAAHAGASFEIDYTTQAISGYYTKVTSVATGQLDVVDSVSGSYNVFILTSINGSSATYNASNNVISTGTFNTLIDPSDTSIFAVDNALYQFVDSGNVATGLYALDDAGIGYVTANGTNINLFFDDLTVDQFTQFYNNYVQISVANGNTNEAIASLKIKQVPAPLPLALLGAGLVGFGVIRRRKAA